MNCPYCNGPTKIINTEKYPRMVTRIRKCIKCGQPIATDEKPRKGAEPENK